jgi:hypothetical protein
MQPLYRRTIDVVLGDPEQVAQRIEVLLGEQEIAVVCRVSGTIVKLEISTLDLEGDDWGERFDAWIEQAAIDVAARIQWSEAS